MLKFVLAAALAFFAFPAAAQTVIPCGGWQGAARNIAEPWEANTRTFANGAIRVALLDTVEPAAGAFYVLVETPPRDELGIRRCGLVAADGGEMGLAGVDFAGVGASYDPATGLTLRFPARRYAPATGGYDPAILAVTINQATGAITPRFEAP